MSIFLIGNVTYAGIYQWTDSQGITHFSDSPHSGAQPVDLAPVQVYSAPVDLTNETKDKNKKIFKYNVFSIKSPEPKATIRNNLGDVPVELEIEPSLRQSDKIQLLMDGKPVGEPAPSLSFMLNNIYRGAHQVSAVVVNDKGKVINTAEAVEFYMHRAIIRH